MKLRFFPLLGGKIVTFLYGLELCPDKAINMNGLFAGCIRVNLVGLLLVSFDTGTIAVADDDVVSPTNLVAGALARQRSWYKDHGAEGCIKTRLSIILNGLVLVDVLGHTNVIAYRPFPSQSFEIRLFDKDGRQITKTIRGRQFGLPLKADAELLDPAHHTIMNVMRDERTINFVLGDSKRLGQFDYLNCFRIREPGTYRLQVEARLFVRGTNAVFQPLIVPPVEMVVKVSETDLGK